MKKLMLAAAAMAVAYVIGSRCRRAPLDAAAAKARRFYRDSEMREKASAAAESVEAAGGVLADRVSQAASYASEKIASASDKIASAFDKPEGTSAAERP